MSDTLMYCIIYENKRIKRYVSDFSKSSPKIKLTHDKNKAIVFSSRLKANHMSRQINTVFDIQTAVKAIYQPRKPLIKEYL